MIDIQKLQELLKIKEPYVYYKETFKCPQESQNEKIKSGWRFFYCKECGRRWISPSRDCDSPSGEDCPCGEFVSPNSRCADSTLPVDDMGNLTIPWKQTFLEYSK